MARVIQADFVSVFEAVCHGFGRIVDPHLECSMRVCFDALEIKGRYLKNEQTESVAYPIWADVLCLESPSTLETEVAWSQFVELQRRWETC